MYKPTMSEKKLVYLYLRKVQKQFEFSPTMEILNITVSYPVKVMKVESGLGKYVFYKTV